MERQRTSVIQPELEKRLLDYVDKHADRLVQILQDLVRIPSENTPPTGSEGECQQHILKLLLALGCEATSYTMDEVEGLKEHPLFRPGRNFQDRPNVAAKLKGTAKGRSLLLSGHVDTVPIGSHPWTKDPFGGEIEGNRLYGRGSNDMKGGVATNLFVVEALRKMNIHPAGDLLFETVIDEEFAGVTGTLAGRVRGFNADAVVLSEPSFLRIHPAQRGGRSVHVILKATGGILQQGPAGASVVEQLTFFLVQIREFAALRRSRAKVHELYRSVTDPVPVSIGKIITSPWGTKEPMSTPAECKLEIFWQAMPGETVEDIDREFMEWLNSLVALPGSPFLQAPEVVFFSRWLPGSAIAADQPLVTELAECATRVVGEAPAIIGLEAPCDMYVFHTVSHTPAVIWGVRGGNTHAPDEYVEIDSLITAAKVLLVFVCQWCGVEADS